MNDTNNTNEKMDLLKKLYARFHNTKICQRIVGLVLTTAVAITLASCDFTVTLPNETETHVSASQNETNNYETEIGSQNNQQNDKLKQYSQLLQNVLTSEEYNNLISQAKSNSSLLETGVFEPHPYAFLEDEGFDVDTIKNGNDLCYTMSYVLDNEPNNLYMYTRVDCGNYYHNYLLCYELTNQEMKDYTTLHGAADYLSAFYIQVCFINNEISKTKDPYVVGESKMSKVAFDTFTEAMHGRHKIETRQSDIIMINPNAKEYYFKLITVPRFPDKAISHNSQIADLDCQAYMHFNGDIYTGPAEYGVFRVTNYQNIDARLFYTQKAPLNYFHCKNLNEISQ